MALSFTKTSGSFTLPCILPGPELRAPTLLSIHQVPSFHPQAKSTFTCTAWSCYLLPLLFALSILARVNVYLHSLVLLPPFLCTWLLALQAESTFTCTQTGNSIYLLQPFIPSTLLRQSQSLHTILPWYSLLPFVSSTLSKVNVYLPRACSPHHSVHVQFVPSLKQNQRLLSLNLLSPLLRTLFLSLSSQSQRLLTKPAALLHRSFFPSRLSSQSQRLLTQSLLSPSLGTHAPSFHCQAQVNVYLQRPITAQFVPSTTTKSTFTSLVHKAVLLLQPRWACISSLLTLPTKLTQLCFKIALIQQVT